MAASRPPGTLGPEQEDTFFGNLDIQIPVVKNAAGRPQREERDVEAEEPRGEEDTENTLQDDAATGERRIEGPTKERSRLEQLTPGESIDEGKTSPETLTLRHIPGGAWLQQRWGATH
ncbi:hypothetical protein NDU88_003191 [Pleurodeles waltl]|uniref:Uncharacterized protein n=1 Tax=Pleurodeles waltl TaxID=8319 RepID=A0AAV7PC00_PLEWA|nr:hypothetical protein NDU88_003191 [Pleurodeles waltl]